jgi:hypothetical protein
MSPIANRCFKRFYTISGVRNLSKVDHLVRDNHLTPHLPIGLIHRFEDVQRALCTYGVSQKVYFQNQSLGFEG